jgi:hypothetical protein
VPADVPGREVEKWCARDIAALRAALTPLLGAQYVEAFLRIPGVRRYFEVVAGERIMAEEHSFKRSDREALRTAARRLGLYPKTLAKRVQRLNRAATIASPRAV